MVCNHSENCTRERDFSYDNTVPESTESKPTISITIDREFIDRQKKRKRRIKNSKSLKNLKPTPKLVNNPRIECQLSVFSKWCSRDINRWFVAIEQQ